MSEPIYFEHVIGADHLDLQDCVIRFRESSNNHLFRIILYKLKKTLNYYVHVKTQYPDKAELWALYEDTLMDCLEKYDPYSGRASFKTYVTRSFDNSLKNLFRSNNYKSMYDLRIEYKDYDGEDCDKIETKSLAGKYLVHVDEHLRLGTHDLLSSLKPVLDNNEYKVCEVIFSENKKLRYKEIAQQTGLTLAAIPNILKRLRKKYERGNFTEIFYKPL